MNVDNIELLRKGLSLLNIEYKESHIDILTNYIEEIIKWKRRFDLVKANEKELVINHILDSLTGLKFIQPDQQRTKLLDIGSGAGFPGIPLSLFIPDRSITLVERMSKRATFLKSITILFNLKHVNVIEDDYKNLTHQYDIILFRALMPLDRELHKIKKKLTVNGIIISYKGKYNKIMEELENIENYQIEKVNVPFLDAERHIVLLY